MAQKSILLSAIDSIGESGKNTVIFVTILVIYLTLLGIASFTAVYIKNAETFSWTAMIAITLVLVIASVTLCSTINVKEEVLLGIILVVLAILVTTFWMLEGTIFYLSCTSEYFSWWGQRPENLTTAQSFLSSFMISLLGALLYSYTAYERVLKWLKQKK